MSVNLYSVYPGKIEILNHPLGDIRVLPCEPDALFSVTVIEDKAENQQGGGIEGAVVNRTIMIPAIEIATWLAQDFAERGVFLAAGSEPTKSEVDAAKAKLAGFFQSQFDIASDSWEKNGVRRGITDIARLAAKHLGATPEWLSADAARANTKECPHCAERVKVKARVCHFCRGSLVEATPPAPPIPQGKPQQAAAR